MKNPNSQEINNQLIRILQSEQFVGSPKLTELLNYLVSKTLEGKQDQLKAYSIAVDVFKRDEDFSSSIDPIVRIQAGRLRRSLDLYYARQGADDPLLISIPKGRYFPHFSFRADESRDHHENDTNRNLPQKVKLHSDFPRMIVVPFINKTGDDSLEYYGSSLGEELSSEFSHFRDLEVVSYHTASKLEVNEHKLDWLEENLGVDFVISGNIHLIDKSPVLKLYLDETINKTQIWFRKFRLKKEGKELNAIIESITESVVSFLGGGFGLISRNLWESVSQKKYSTLQGRRAIYLYRLTQINVNMVGYEKAEEEIYKAVSEDPGFALGWATLAEIHCDYYSHSLDNRSQNLNTSMAYLDKALQIDPCLQYAYHVKAYICLHQKEYKAAREASKHVYQLNPKDSYLTGIAGFWLALAGDLREGLSMIKRSIKLNPYYPTYLHHAFMLDHIERGEYDKAVSQAVAFNHHQYFWSHIDKAAAYGLIGEIKKASEHYQILIELLPAFIDNPLEFLRIFVCMESLQEKMMEGLTAAGLK